MDDRQRYEEARSVSESIQQTTVEDLKPEDLYERHDTTGLDKEKKNTPSKVSDRLQGLKERLRGKVERFNQRYPQASEAARYAGKGIGFVARRNAYGRIASSVYDAYQHGKQLEDFIREAQAARKAEEKAAKGQNFSERAAKTRQRTVSKIEWQLNNARDTGKLEKGFLVDEVRYSNQQKIDKLSQNLESARKFRSLEEILSKNSQSAELERRFQESRAIADEYRKSLMKGTAQDKYHYLLDESRKSLGDSYYDVNKHPQRAIQFDGFAARRLYEDGLPKEQVKQAIERGAFQPSLAKSPYAQEYTKRTFDPIAKESDAVREQVQNWQSINGDRLAGAKINPEEAKKFDELKEQAKTYRLQKTSEVRALAQETLQRYKADNAQWDKISTQDEYLIEAGRRIEAGKSPDDRKIVSKLMLAERDDKSIIDTLQQYSPNMNGSGKNSEAFLRDLRLEHQKDLQYWNELQKVRDFKESNGIPSSENRLDRLNLSYDQKEGRLNPQTFRNTTKELLEDTYKPEPSKQNDPSPTTRQNVDSTKSQTHDSYDLER